MKRQAVPVLLLAAGLVGCAACGGPNDCCPGSYLSSWNAGSYDLAGSVEIRAGVRYALSADFTRLATYSDNWGGGGVTVNFRDVRDGTRVGDVELDTHIGSGPQPVFSPDLRWLAMFPYVHGGQASRFLLWDQQSGAVHAEFPDATAIGFSPDGSRLLTFGPADPPAQERRATWWDVATHTEVEAFTVAGLPLKLEPSTERVVVGVAQPGASSTRRSIELLLVDATAGGGIRPLGEVEFSGWDLAQLGQNIAFSADGSTLALSGEMGLLVWDLDALPAAPVTAPTAFPTAGWVALSTSGERLVIQTAGWDAAANCGARHVEVWDRTSGETRTLEEPLLEGARQAAFLPDGSLLSFGRPCFALCDYGHRIC